MEILTWINKNLSEIQSTLLYGRYFDSILLECEDDTYYLLNPHLGIDLMLNENYIIKSIHLYSGKQKETKQFSDKLPFDLSFSFSCDHTRSLLGSPVHTGGGDFSLLYGKAPFWDKYRYDNFYLHLQFAEDKKSIDLITIDAIN